MTNAELLQRIFDNRRNMDSKTYEHLIIESVNYYVSENDFPPAKLELFGHSYNITLKTGSSTSVTHGVFNYYNISKGVKNSFVQLTLECDTCFLTEADGDKVISYLNKVDTSITEEIQSLCSSMLNQNDIFANGGNSELNSPAKHLA